MHQAENRDVMDPFHKWLTEQFDQKIVEPNSSLGKSISYMLNHWKTLTLFLREPGAPLDNNICERGLKMSIRIAVTHCSIRLVAVPTSATSS